MTRSRTIAAGVFVAAALAGTLIDSPAKAMPAGATILSADLHVHAFPADGMLPVWAVQREAERRGLDVIVITNHNRNFAMPMAAASGLLRDYPIVIPGQELTTPSFHMAAVGVREMIDWRLSIGQAIAAIHAQGGVAIAAHPAPISWRNRDPLLLAMLDGAEVAHPTMYRRPRRERDLRDFYSRARRWNADLAPIGSSDYHGGVPLGMCRTYLLVNEVSREGVLDAIRHGRTVASGPGDRLFGDEQHVAAVRARFHDPPAVSFRSGLPTILSLIALIALAVLAL